MNAPDNIKSAKKNAVAVELPLMAKPDQPAEMTPEAARNLLTNATAEFERVFPPENAAEAVAQAVTTPAQRTDATIAQFKARGVKFPQDTAGAVLCGVQDESEAGESAAVALDDADEKPEVDAVLARRKAEGESGLFWGIPPQREIRVSTISDGDIEIEEISPLGSDEDARIVVNVSNAVRMARSILYAAGFQGILIATTDGGGGYRDLDDGAEAWQFEREREGAN